MSIPDDNFDPETPTVDLEVSLVLTLNDTEMVTAMQAATGLPSLEAVIEQALFWYAGQLQVGPVPQDFMLFRRRLNAMGRPWSGYEAKHGPKKGKPQR